MFRFGHALSGVSWVWILGILGLELLGVGVCVCGVCYLIVFGWYGLLAGVCSLLLMLVCLCLRNVLIVLFSGYSGCRLCDYSWLLILCLGVVCFWCWLFGLLVGVLLLVLFCGWWGVVMVFVACGFVRFCGLFCGLV